MSDLTAKFSALEAELTIQHDEVQARLDTLDSNVGGIGEAITVLTNAVLALNRAQAPLLAASDPCADCPPPSLEVPPADAVGHAIDEDRCKRAQALIRFIRSYVAVQNAASAFSVAFTPTMLVNAVAQALTNIGSSDTPPTPSFPEIVQLAGDLLNFTGNNFLVGGSLLDYFDAVSGAARNAIYGAATTEVALAQYKSIMLSAASPGYANNVLADDGYIGAFNWFLSPDNSPDLTGLDGTICGAGLHDITDCTDVAAILFHDDDGFDRYHIIAAPSLGGNPTYVGGDFLHWTIQVIDGTVGKDTLIYYLTSPTSGAFEAGIDVTSPAHEISHANVGLLIFTDHDGIGTRPFTIRICPPAE
jgi:hypothetical protein